MATHAANAQVTLGWRGAGGVDGLRGVAGSRLVAFPRYAGLMRSSTPSTAVLGLAAFVGAAVVSGAACDAEPEGAGGASASTAMTSAGGSAGGGGDANVGGEGPGMGGGGTGAGGNITLPTGDARFDYQLGGAYAPPTGVTIVVRDRTASIEPGLYNICYVNGFQIQPSEEAWWLDNHPDLILRDGGGDPVIDVDWDEMLLDVGTADKRTAIAAIVADWISGCGGDGYLAVEIDNLDSYTRSKGLLVQQNAVDFMALLSAHAHSAGMAIAQKNATELLAQRQAMGTDFAVAEECHRYDECQDYVDAYGDRVFVVEYRKQDFDKGCNAHPSLSILLRDLDLVTPTDNGYIFDDC